MGEKDGLSPEAAMRNIVDAALGVRDMMMMMGLVLLLVFVCWDSLDMKVRLRKRERDDIERERIGNIISRVMSWHTSRPCAFHVHRGPPNRRSERPPVPFLHHREKEQSLNNCLYYTHLVNIMDRFFKNPESSRVEVMAMMQAML